MPTKPAAAKTSKAAPKITAKAAPAKPATARKPAAKPKIAATAAKPQVKEQSMNEVVEITDPNAKIVAQMKVKDLIERVAAASDHNKKDVRAIVEATLAELGKALEAGETLILPPFGRVRIANQKSDAAGQLMTLKLRRGGEKKPGKNAGEALAEASEAS
ncbi:HU family DNA-binding protein [Cypionkella sp.]|uniref:HU family DNA-binding protein n=1 Tax=Cypionkella sp. TaxID=2811411 RepID=UPI002AB9F355|nr:HU family DNA-binding protein [Cypionkella sp.]MDZ4393778.1 HU family DNA-binding protein [Cypionkella sp.]